jgi:hypothetical protein
MKEATPRLTSILQTATAWLEIRTTVRQWQWSLPEAGASIRFVKRLSNRSARSSDCVEIPEKWAGLFRSHERTSGNKPAYVYVCLSEAKSETFQLLKGGNNHAITLPLMAHLSQIKVKIRTFDAQGVELTLRRPCRRVGDKISAASASALAVGLRSDDNLFAFLLFDSPGTVMCELTWLGSGAYITPSTARTALMYAADAMVQPKPSDQPRRQLADAAANLVRFCLRQNVVSEDLKRQVETLSEDLANDILREYGSSDAVAKRIATGKAGVACGLIMSGTLKRVLELDRADAVSRERARAVIHALVGLINLAPLPWVDVLVNPAKTAADIIFDNFFPSATQGLKHEMDDLVTDTFYWPLTLNGGVAFIPQVTFDDDGVRLFKVYFELVMRSNHF